MFALQFSNSLKIQENEIIYQVPDGFTKKYIENLLPDLVHFLRKHLQNTHIDLKIEIVKCSVETNPNEILLQRMIEKNKNISLLKNHFDLIFLD